MVFLLKLKEFDPERLPEFMKHREGTGLTAQQIRDWVDMFKIQGTNRYRRPWWANQVGAFSGYNRSVRWDDVVAAGKDICPNCQGQGCEFCDGSGKLPAEQRAKVIGDMEKEKFKAALSPSLKKYYSSNIKINFDNAQLIYKHN